MERGSTKHGPLKDDNLKHDVEPMVRSAGPAHVEEWRDPEPPADDDLFAIRGRQQPETD
jgi:hypothetical protein